MGVRKNQLESSASRKIQYYNDHPSLQPAIKKYKAISQSVKIAESQVLLLQNQAKIATKQKMVPNQTLTSDKRLGLIQKSERIRHHIMGIKMDFQDVNLRKQAQDDCSSVSSLKSGNQVIYIGRNGATIVNYPFIIGQRKQND